MPTQKESRGRWVVSGHRHFLATVTLGKRPGNHCTECQAWCGQVRKVLPPTGIRSPGRPDRIESLYQLCYTGAHLKYFGRDNVIRGQCYRR